ncbi:MAG TPA: DNA repair protein RecN [Candidatus Kapabacteria bacterium]|jgi:DNA repair protein RecN (Recombination protein N)|nr:DNA repair protein RecN [Candidatus Kapabacteria bacterium]HOV91680.1 DNA repair protein RecN [Candidatus Kapabacteria bacterium]
MLKSLSVKNFAIIKEQFIEFDPTLNIIIGETGAGKSIIIDSLSILLGDRASTSYIRQGENRAIIEGVFILKEDNPIFDILKELDIEIYPELIIRREISSNNISRNFINDSPVQLNILKRIGDMLIDFHGQYEHQSLLMPENHISILDAYANVSEELQLYQKNYKKLREIFKEYNDLINKELEFEEIQKIKQEQLSEIIKVNPVKDEDILLENELRKLENIEVIFSNLKDISDVLFREENSIYEQIIQVEKRLQNLAKIDKNFEIYSNEINQIIPTIKEIINYTNDYIQNFTFDPNRIEDINKRLYELQNFKRKYGTIDEALERKERLEQELSESNSYKNVLIDLENGIKNLKGELSKIAKLLSQKREKASIKFKKEIEALLKEMGLNHIEFENRIQKQEADKEDELALEIDGEYYKADNNGIDKLEFYISTNKGEDPKPLRKIASGGELSRIMLALKEMGAANRNMPILVFDEIDAGVSGRIAERVGQQMSNLSQNHQIIAITHSPQIAAKGKKVIFISKIENQDRTEAIANELNESEIVTEIARLLSGEKITESAVQAAKELRSNKINR